MTPLFFDTIFLGSLPLCSLASAARAAALSALLSALVVLFAALLSLLAGSLILLTGFLALLAGLLALLAGLALLARLVVLVHIRTPLGDRKPTNERVLLFPRAAKPEFMLHKS